MPRKLILIVFGTRPEAIKMCPLIQELRSRGRFKVVVCVSGQHREMLDEVLTAFDVIPDYDLDIMHSGQNLFDITTKVMSGLQRVLEECNPDIVLVHGDTTTSYAAAVAAFYMQTPIGHIEAGLRTGNIYSPWPEEFNRKSIDIIANYYFAPTKASKDNLLAEGVEAQRVFVTGNTGIDALKTTTKVGYRNQYLEWATGSRLILITAHRRENLGSPMHAMFRGIRRAMEELQDTKALYPVHMNPEVREIAELELNGFDRIKLIDPLSVIDFHNIMASCHLVLTDSGGIQEEAPSLGKPVLVMRDTTERPEGIEAGTLKLVGTTEENIYKSIMELLTNDAAYKEMSKSVNPYGDGRASVRIADILEERL